MKAEWRWVAKQFSGENRKRRLVETTEIAQSCDWEFPVGFIARNQLCHQLMWDVFGMSWLALQKWHRFDEFLHCRKKTNKQKYVKCLNSRPDDHESEPRHQHQTQPLSPHGALSKHKKKKHGRSQTTFHTRTINATLTQGHLHSNRVTFHASTSRVKVRVYGLAEDLSAQAWLSCDSASITADGMIWHQVDKSCVRSRKQGLSIAPPIIIIQQLHTIQTVTQSEVFVSKVWRPCLSYSSLSFGLTSYTFDAPPPFVNQKYTSTLCQVLHIQVFFVFFHILWNTQSPIFISFRIL